MFEKFVFVLKIPAIKVEELCGTNSWFSLFSEKDYWAISVCDVTDDLYSEYEADLHMEHNDFVSSEPGYFYGIFCSLPCGTSRNK